MVSSPIFGYSADYTWNLGEKMRNASGHVVGARSVRSFFITEFDNKKIEESRGRIHRSN